MEMNVSHHQLKANVSMLQCGFRSNVALTYVGFCACKAPWTRLFTGMLKQAAQSFLRLSINSL